MSRTEKDFQAEIRQSLKTLGGPRWYHKIPDVGFRNPFDSVLVFGGIAYALEYKVSKNKTSIPLQALFVGRSHELVALRTFKASGGRSYVLINVFSAHRQNVVVIMDIDDYDELVRECEPSKSVKLNDPRLARFPVMKKVKWDYDSHWNLGIILNYEKIRRSLVSAKDPVQTPEGT